MAALAALALSASLSPLRAEESAIQSADFVAVAADSAVEQVSYTVGQSGHPYKWISCGPDSARRTSRPLQADAAQFNSPVLTAADGPAVPHPIDDPFGDRLQPVEQPSLPDVQQLLADDTDKKVPIDSLLSPPTDQGGTTARQPLSSLPSLEAEPQIDLPTTEDYLAAEGLERNRACQNPDELLRAIGDLDYMTDIRDASINRDNRPVSCTLGGGQFVPRQWAPTTFMWQASGLCHKPAYFEDVHLERYGHSWGPYIQPLMSGAHFFLNVPVLPYKMGLYPPNECIYTLGYYRPGSCAPYMLDPLPLSVRAALAQGGAVVGLAYLIP
ncbi:MAG: hypothetical protein ACYC6Y_16025 [Thermoguttaceae bacterium]